MSESACARLCPGDFHAEQLGSLDQELDDLARAFVLDHVRKCDTAERRYRSTTRGPPPVDSNLIELLVARDGMATIVELRDGRRLDVHNIAWGYDVGDEHAHVTTNCSPALPSLSMDFFYTSEVESVWDETGAVLRSG